MRLHLFWWLDYLVWCVSLVTFFPAKVVLTGYF